MRQSALSYVFSICRPGIIEPVAPCNAVFHMLTCGENSIRRVIAVNWDGKAMPPCGARRELMVQLMPDNYRAVEIMLDYENEKVVTLGELTPEWWL